MIALTLSTQAVTSTAAPPPAGAAPNPTTATVTLVTGDSVRITRAPGQPDRTTFLPAPGTPEQTVRTTRRNGHTYVVPASAQAGIDAGRLDPALFDVTTLLAEGVTDNVPVIVRYAEAARTAAGSALPGTTGGRVLNSLGARSTRVRPGSAFWKSVNHAAVTKISLDRRVKSGLDRSVPQIGGPAAWQRGLTGKGVKIAVLDTGIDPTHPDLAGRIAAAQDFTGAGDPIDRNGHGTHVAGIAAGNGTASDGKYRGVAPEATLLNAKVLGDDGSGTNSSVIAGMEWAAAQGASVLNLSLAGGESDGSDELSEALNRISRQTGALFVVGAGNCYGGAPWSPNTVTAPGAADEAVAIGNLMLDGSVAEDSCRGPRKLNGALKPDLAAPGTDIVSARAAGTDLGTPVGDSYSSLSGTSMATPHVAGTAALLLQQHPTWKNAALRARLISTADPQPGSPAAAQGAGRVDADQATAGGPSVNTGQLDLGLRTWPHPQTDVVTRDLTYRNPTGTPITLQLAVDFEQPTVAPRLSATQVVVPADGEAKVTVTADRSAGGIGNFAGRITATAPGADPLVTVIGWYAEPERYELSFTAVARDGSPVPNAEVTLQRLDGDQPDLGPEGVVRIVNGTAKLRLPPGRYDAAAFIGSSDRTDLVLTGEFELRKDTALTLDARKTQAVDLTIDAKARLRGSQLTHVRVLAEDRQDLTINTGAEPHTFGATRITTAPTIGTAETSFSRRFEAKDTVYDLLVPWTGKLPTDTTLRFKRDQFAIVDESFGAHVPSTPVVERRLGLTPASAMHYPGAAAELTTPARRTSYVLANQAKWSSSVVLDEASYLVLFAPTRSYHAGVRTAERWMTPVLTSGLPGADGEEPAAVVHNPGFLAVSFAPFANSTSYLTPWTGSGTHQLEVTRNGKQLISTEAPTGYGRPTDNGPADYTINLTSSPDPKYFRYSTKAVSRWTFRSLGGDEERLPLILADVDVPQTDLLSQVRTGRPSTVEVSLRHQFGSTTTAKFTKPNLELSYDGEHWTTLPLTESGGKYVAKLTHPTTAAGKSPSLRLTATDTAGSTFAQEITAAYGLK
nr:S8 family peptidase [Kribbella sandramycini]